ncbi:MAG: cation:dicarboxylase symporter family transporter [Mycoplasmataceae bacterium]|nr:cation:dicarboxylase symporter family transporter [Mycoplasmataceae bacterium]
MVFANNASELLWMSSTESIIAFLFILLSSIAMIFIIVKKGLNKGTVAAIGIGIIGVVIFFSIWASEGKMVDGIYISSSMTDYNGDIFEITFDINNNIESVVQMSLGADGNYSIIADTALGQDVIFQVDETVKLNFKGINAITGDPYIGFVKDGDYIYGSTWSSEALLWFDLIPTIFLNLIQLTVVPLVFITAIWIVSVKSKESNMSSKSFAKSVGWLSLVEMIGILVGFLMIPLIKIALDPSLFGGDATRTIDSFDSVWGIFLGWFPDNWDSLLVGTAATISLLLIGLTIGAALRKLDSSGNEIASDATKFVDLFHKLFTQIVKWVLYLLPFVIFSKLPALSFGNAASSWSYLGMLIGIVFLGMLIMFTIHFVVITLQAGPGFSKEWFKGIKGTALTAIFTRSSIAALPQNQKNLIDAGVSVDVASTVPTLNTSMGLSTCAGMYPTVISLFALFQSNPNPSWIDFVLIFVVIFLTSFGVAGVPGAFEATSITTLSILGLGTTSGIILTVQVLEPILDPFRTVTNITGGNMATVIMDKSYKRKKLKDSSGDPGEGGDDLEFKHVNPSSINPGEFELNHVIEEDVKGKEIASSKKDVKLVIDSDDIKVKPKKLIKRKKIKK